jgi:dihydropteroate synthase
MKSPLIMAILNITPDSFSDRGKNFHVSDAVSNGKSLLSQGAHILDIGGMASGPNSTFISVEEELHRIIPIVHSLAAEAIISIDTFRSTAARACLEQGARIINDISALRYDPDMAKLIRDFKASVVMMYSKEDAEHPLVTSKNATYTDIIATIKEFFSERIDYALANGINPEQIILDPGMGAFISNDPAYSWEILDRIAELKSNFKDYKLLVGVSRKGFLGVPMEERDKLSMLVNFFVAQDGVDIVRTHRVGV